MPKPDEQLLLDCYTKIAKARLGRNSVQKPCDRSVIAYIDANIAQIVNDLSEPQFMTPQEIRKNIRRGKTMYQQYLATKAKDPGIIPAKLEWEMFRLIRALSSREADSIEEIRNKEPLGKYLDLGHIMARKESLNKFKNFSAQEIVQDAILRGKAYTKTESSFYISRTGSKYHVYSCPYCKGRILSRAMAAEIERRRLLPCNCIAEASESQRFATIFVDESIHPSMWNRDGEEGNVGSFSYIICQGFLTDESMITKDNIIVQDVDYCKENVNTEKVTVNAIRKALLTLAYDYEFDGKVQVYADNLSAVEHWGESRKNKKYCDLFETVQITHIQRELNTKADKLGRTRMILDIPMETYNQAVMKCKSAENYERVVGWLNRRCERAEMA